MRIETFGGLTCRIVGGTDRQGGGTGPAVVLLHGFGAPGEDLVGLWRVLRVAPEVRFVFPEAPLDLAGAARGFGFMGDARAWWLIDIDAMQRALVEGRARDLSAQDPEGIAPARASVLAMLEEMERALAVRPEHVVLGGFSQGAMLSLDVALRSERPLAALALLSGTLLARDAWVPEMARRTGMRALLSHGQSDPLLPYTLAEELRDHLVAAGWRATWVPHRGGHEIPGPVLSGLEAFLGAVATPLAAP